MFDVLGTIYIINREMDTLDIIGHTTRNMYPIRKISQVGVHHHVPTKTIHIQI